MSDLQDAIHRAIPVTREEWSGAMYEAAKTSADIEGYVVDVADWRTITKAARKYANLPDFPGFARWHDALVVRGVDYIDEYRDEDDGLIDWITAVLALSVTENE